MQTNQCNKTEQKTNRWRSLFVAVHIRLYCWYVCDLCSYSVRYLQVLILCNNSVLIESLTLLSKGRNDIFLFIHGTKSRMVSRRHKGHTHYRGVYYSSHLWMHIMRPFPRRTANVLLTWRHYVVIDSERITRSALCVCFFTCLSKEHK